MLRIFERFLRHKIRHQSRAEGARFFSQKHIHIAYRNQYFLGFGQFTLHSDFYTTLPSLRQVARPIGRDEHRLQCRRPNGNNKDQFII